MPLAVSVLGAGSPGLAGRGHDGGRVHLQLPAPGGALPATVAPPPAADPDESPGQLVVQTQRGRERERGGSLGVGVLDFAHFNDDDDDDDCPFVMCPKNSMYNFRVFNL